jgi:hypothetical protein
MEEITPNPAPENTPAVGRQELIFAICALICGAVLCNFTFFGGFNLGFAIATVLTLGCAVGYLVVRGCRPGFYAGALLFLSAVIAAGFARTDDGFVKFMMLLFLAVSINLGLCLLAKQNLFRPGGITSLLDACRSYFLFGYGGIPLAFRSLRALVQQGGPAVKKLGAVAIGFALSVPLLGIMIALLKSADAAFSGVLQLLPSFSLWETGNTLFFGTCFACVIFTQSLALKHRPHSAPLTSGFTLSVNALTINTVLIGVSAVFFVYLISQLAYFGGGFAGILPEKYTMAEYARRGFFEMAWLCAINLGVIALAAGLVRRKEGKLPLLTKLLCLFIALMTLFFVVSASAKMMMYIDSYGLTRLRVLTEVIMIFLGLATATVALWLFIPKLPYFKVVLLLALVIGATVLWADVDTVVADYNVTAYQQGKLETVDVSYLSTLGKGAKPHIARLLDDSNPNVAQAAKRALTRFPNPDDVEKDFRDWNYVNHAADQLPSNKA